MTLENYLQENEEVIAKVSQRNVKFYATNKKIIRHQGNTLSEKVDMIFYPHISSISITSYLYNGIALIIAGIILLIFSFTYFDDLLKIFDISNNELVGMPTIIFVLFSVGIIIQGIYNLKRSSLNFVIAGFSTTDKIKWNIQRAKLNELRKFVKAIQGKVAERLVEIERIMERSEKNRKE